jgi:hypothetical protein
MVKVTLGTLRARAREYADMRKTDFVQDDAFSLDGHINDALQELLSITAEAYGSGVAIPTPILTVADQELYPLPVDCFRVVYLKYETSHLPRYDTGNSRCSCPRWAQEALGVRISPPFKTANLSLQLGYIPTFPVLADPLTEVTLVPQGDSYVAARAAMALLAKEESDYSFVAAQMQTFEERIRFEGWQQKPPGRVRDTRRHRCVGVR